MESDEEPRKSHKRKREKVKATVNVLDNDLEKIPPIVGYFPSGYSPNPSSESDVRVFRNKSKPGRIQVAFRPPESPVEFVGSSFSGEPTAVQGCSYALGVLDKEAGVLRVVPIAANRVFRLEPKVPAKKAREVDDQQSELAVEEHSAQNKYESLRHLTNVFGTKRSIKRDQKMQALKQADDPNSQNDLDQKIKEVKINKEALEHASSHTVRNIPPYNSSATTPKEAYPLDKIIFKGEWDYMGDIFELLEAGEKVSSPAYPTFVCHRIPKLQETKDETEKQTLGSIFSYITHLIRFKDRHSVDTASSAKDYKTPPILRQKFWTMFSDPGTKFLVKEKIDLLISYVLVLTLFADDFQTNPADISKDLRMSSVNLRKHFLHLGCNFRRQEGALVAYLPVPLKFPEIKRKRHR